MKLSIITVNLNNARGLERTILSVINQKFVDFEYIVIDGGSTDDSIQIINKYNGKLNSWISEKDNGIFHAMNKGIKLARGEYLFMLNSGDYLENASILSDIFDNKEYLEEILYGDIRWENNGIFYRNDVFPSDLDFEFFCKNSIGHQATFIKKEVHNTVGYYDASMKICADWKFFLLAQEKHKLLFYHLPFVVSVGDCDGVSWDLKSYFIIAKEKKETIKEFFPMYFKLYKSFHKNKIILFKIRLKLIKRSF